MVSAAGGVGGECCGWWVVQVVRHELILCMCTGCRSQVEMELLA